MDSIFCHWQKEKENRAQKNGNSIVESKGKESSVEDTFHLHCIVLFALYNVILPETV